MLIYSLYGPDSDGCYSIVYTCAHRRRKVVHETGFPDYETAKTECDKLNRGKKQSEAWYYKPRIERKF